VGLLCAHKKKWGSAEPLCIRKSSKKLLTTKKLKINNNLTL
jgi:hypothetical protein